MLKYFLFIAIFFSSVTVFAQSKKVITHEDMWLMKRVGAPEISPDGKWVVFSVLDPAYDETMTYGLYQLTATVNQENSPVLKQAKAITPGALTANE